MKKLCAQPGCHALVSEGTIRCADHNKDVRDSSRARGYSHRWSKAAEHYRKLNPLCVHCLANGVTKKAECVDHIRPHEGSSVLFWDVANWQSLCNACHQVKTNSERAFTSGNRHPGGAVSAGARKTEP